MMLVYLNVITMCMNNTKQNIIFASITLIATMSSNIQIKVEE